MLPMLDEGILEKLEAHTPGATEDVISLFCIIGESRRAMERDALEAQYSRTRSFSLRRIFAEVFGGWVVPKSRLPDAVAQTTNDDLRRAILVYMTRRRISAADIGLSADEEKSLRSVRGAVGPGCKPDCV